MDIANFCPIYRPALPQREVFLFVLSPANQRAEGLVVGGGLHTRGSRYHTDRFDDQDGLTFYSGDFK